jgi:hypothetical protein
LPEVDAEISRAASAHSGDLKKSAKSMQIESVRILRHGPLRELHRMSESTLLVFDEIFCQIREAYSQPTQHRNR